MKKIFFPFKRKDREMSKYWWHRLFAVLFIAALILIPVSVFLGMVNGDASARMYCLVNEIYENCFEMIPIRTGISLAVALFWLVAINYLAPLFYYKVFLYIILGEDKPEKKEEK